MFGLHMHWNLYGAFGAIDRMPAEIGHVFACFKVVKSVSSDNDAMLFALGLCHGPECCVGPVSLNPKCVN